MNCTWLVADRARLAAVVLGALLLVCHLSDVVRFKGVCRCDLARREMRGEAPAELLGETSSILQ